MSSSGSSRMRRLSPRGSALAVVAGGVLVASTLAGCGAGKTSSAASSSAPSSAASSATKASDLARGLLPAQAFGADAAVSTLTVQQLQQGTGMAGGSLQGAQITPEACAALVRSTHPGGGDKLSGAAAEVARQGTSTTAEVLAVSDEAKTLVSAVDAAIGTCPQVQVTAPSLGTATISFSTFDVPKLGDGSAGIAFTTVATVPGGQQVSVPALLGLAVDGKRLVTLVTADP
ncbi:MAG: hypothetical protein ACXVX3_20840, partial [Blastococcus sp.]